MGNTAEAQQTVKAALELQPTFVDAMLLNGQLMMQTGDAEAAVEVLRQAAKLEPKNYEVRFQLARALGLAGRREESKQQNEVAEELLKKHEEFTRLNSQAIKEPFNVELRIEIGERAIDLDKPDAVEKIFVSIFIAHGNLRFDYGICSLLCGLY